MRRLDAVIIDVGSHTRTASGFDNLHGHGIQNENCVELEHHSTEGEDPAAEYLSWLAGAALLDTS